MRSWRKESQSKSSPVGVEVAGAAGDEDCELAWRAAQRVGRAGERMGRREAARSLVRMGVDIVASVGGVGELVGGVGELVGGAVVGQRRTSEMT